MSARDAALSALPEITITRVFDAPRDVVFRLWTDPELVAQWWGIEGSTNPVCRLDVRPGGTWRIDMRTADGTVYPNCGVYLEVVLNERIVYTDVADSASPAWDGNPPRDVVHTVTFDDDGDKTKITLHARFKSVAERKRMVESGVVQGIGQSLDRLERLLALLRAKIVPS